MGVNGLIAKVEDAGYAINGVVAAIRTRAALRSLKDSNGHPLFVADMKGNTP